MRRWGEKALVVVWMSQSVTASAPIYRGVKNVVPEVKVTFTQKTLKVTGTEMLSVPHRRSVLPATG